MAKKIVISFLGQPEITNGFSYSIFVNNTQVVYENGLNTLLIKYRDFGTGNLPPDGVERQLSLSDTINFTLQSLIDYYVYSNIYYYRSANTIEVIINTSDVIDISFFNSDANIVMEEFIIPETENINLRYFFQYKNIVNDEYLCQIFNKNYFGLPSEIRGRATLEKNSVKDHLEPIRGTGLSLQLEASLGLTLDDLYSQNEQDFTVRLYKNGKIQFVGFLKPDGIFQSFTRDIWVISLDCIDGLGAIENLSFVRANGLRFSGKISAIDIIYNCLKRTGISLPINTSINTIYDGLVRSDNLDILTKIKLNSDRFFKVDGQNAGDGTIMSCQEVLKSVLDVFCANITQYNGEWYIYKANEIFLESNVLFRRYDIHNAYNGNSTLPMSQILGSQIDNFYPYHCAGNQHIEIKGGVSAFRVGYKYGFVSGLLENGTLVHDGGLNYTGWTVDSINKSFLINDPLDINGLKMHPDTVPVSPIKLLATSNAIALLTGDTFNLTTTLKANGATRFFFRVRLNGIYSMNVNGEWALDTVSFAYIQPVIFGNEPSSGGLITKSYDIPSFPLPVDGNVTVEIYVSKSGTPAQNPINATFSEVHSVDLINTFAGDNTVGEFHTVSRATKISTIIKENKQVSNGDNAGIVYLGAIFKENGIDPTNTWNRKIDAISKPLLQIAAEEELRIAQKPLKMFKGSIFGFIPYLSVININNIDGKFMPIEYSYDTFSNITTLKSLELFSSEISDIIYTPTFDYGNVVRPTIKG